MSLSSAPYLLALLLVLGCGASERGSASASDAPPCLPRPEGTREWTCAGPMPLYNEDGSYKDGCKHAKGAGSTEVEARINAANDCRVQLYGTRCASGAIETKLLNCLKGGRVVDGLVEGF